MGKGSALVLAGALVLAACGGDGDPTNAERPDGEQTPEVLPTSTRPTPTPVAAVPEPEALVYTVQSGDLLGTIAQTFGVSVEDILDANPEITDPNVIAVGDEIVIPQVVEAAPTAAVTGAAPTAAADPAIPDD